MKIIQTLLMTMLAAGMMTACGNSDQNSIVPDQRETITKFLEANELDYEEVNGVFRHFGARGDANAPTVKNGNRVGIYYELYKAKYTSYKNEDGRPAPLPTTAIYSNKPFIQDTLYSIGLDPSYWPEGIYNATVGSGDLISGLNRGLVGCRQGDSVLLFITSDLAFGGKPVATLYENTPVLYVVNIETVNNQ